MGSTPVWFFLVVLTGCGDTLGPLSDLHGLWRGIRIDSGIQLVLAENGAIVTGDGTWTNTPFSESGTVAATGTHIGPAVVLTLKYDNGVTTRYEATMRDARRMSGSERFPDGSVTNLFFVMVQP